LTSGKYTNIAANGTVVVATGQGVLRCITINSKGATGNTATVYDNTSAAGNKIATIDTTSGVLTLRYDCEYATGLTVVLANGTTADITVVTA
jgi:hypothetical protein